MPQFRNWLMLRSILLDVQKNKGVEYALADATLYLELFGIVAVAWQWLIQAVAVVKGLEGNPSKSEKAFYRGKVRNIPVLFRL